MRCARMGPAPRADERTRPLQSNPRVPGGPVGAVPRGVTVNTASHWLLPMMILGAVGRAQVRACDAFPRLLESVTQIDDFVLCRFDHKIISASWAVYSDREMLWREIPTEIDGAGINRMNISVYDPLASADIIN